MREILELNRYAHDFTSAMWVCGCILIWRLCTETKREGALAETKAVLSRLIGNLKALTLPSLVITLVSGGIRALTFSKYEYEGEITTSVIAVLIVKHVFFAAVVAWGTGIHWGSRRVGATSAGIS